MLRSNLLRILPLLIAIFALPGCCGSFSAPENARFDAGWLRFCHALDAQRRGDMEAGSAELASLWTEVTDPRAPSGTFYYGNMTGAVGKLIQDYPPAGEHFAPWRDPLERRVLSGSGNSRDDALWLEFTQAAGDESALVAYAARFRSDRSRMTRLNYMPYHAFERLTAAGRWDLAGWLYSDPVAECAYRGEPGPMATAGGLALTIVAAPAWIPLARGIAPRVFPDFPWDSLRPPKRPSHAEEQQAQANYVGFVARVAASCAAAGRTKDALKIEQGAESLVGTQASQGVFTEAYRAAGVARLSR